MKRILWVIGAVTLLMAATVAGAETKPLGRQVELGTDWQQAGLVFSEDKADAGFVAAMDSPRSAQRTKKAVPVLARLESAMNLVRFSIDGDSLHDPVYCLRLCLGW